MEQKKTPTKIHISDLISSKDRPTSDIPWTLTNVDLSYSPLLQTYPGHWPMLTCLTVPYFRHALDTDQCWPVLQSPTSDIPWTLTNVGLSYSPLLQTYPGHWPMLDCLTVPYFRHTLDTDQCWPVLQSPTSDMPWTLTNVGLSYSPLLQTYPGHWPMLACLTVPYFRHTVDTDQCWTVLQSPTSDIPWTLTNVDLSYSPLLQTYPGHWPMLDCLTVPYFRHTLDTDQCWPVLQSPTSDIPWTLTNVDLSYSPLLQTYPGHWPMLTCLTVPYFRHALGTDQCWPVLQSPTSDIPWTLTNVGLSYSPLLQTCPGHWPMLDCLTVPYFRHTVDTDQCWTVLQPPTSDIPWTLTNVGLSYSPLLQTYPGHWPMLDCLTVPYFRHALDTDQCWPVLQSPTSDIPWALTNVGLSYSPLLQTYPGHWPMLDCLTAPYFRHTLDTDQCWTVLQSPYFRHTLDTDQCWPVLQSPTSDITWTLTNVDLSYSPLLQTYRGHWPMLTCLTVPYFRHALDTDQCWPVLQSPTSDIPWTLTNVDLSYSPLLQTCPGHWPMLTCLTVPYFRHTLDTDQCWTVLQSPTSDIHWPVLTCFTVPLIQTCAGHWPMLDCLRGGWWSQAPRLIDGRALQTLSRIYIHSILSQFTSHSHGLKAHCEGLLIYRIRTMYQDKRIRTILGTILPTSPVSLELSPPLVTEGLRVPIPTHIGQGCARMLDHAIRMQNSFSPTVYFLASFWGKIQVT